ncbi:MAG: LLM class flavin-dependent oxidoreductase [Alphaproteobacteria bacterium]|nr:MAG: LLM class flavin-dependent oxidoreductase [Alphaproteobacteria bacterium]
MQFGFNLPNTGALAAPDNVVRIAREGETLGYDYLTVTDHVVLPDMAEPGYPYSESGAFYSRDSAYRHEMLTLAAYLAAVTAKLRVVLAVLVVPHRPAVLAAKMLSTIDDLAAFRTLWTKEKPCIDGRYVHYDGLVLEPKPAQKPHPPIWVGGESGPSLRRAARFGDAWYPIGSNNAHLLDTLPRYQAGVARLRQLTAAAGRDANAVALTYRVKRYGDAVPAIASDGNRRLFSGSDADLIADIRTLRDLGVTAIDFDFERPRADDVIAEMSSFRDRVLARV